MSHYQGFRPDKKTKETEKQNKKADDHLCIAAMPLFQYRKVPPK